MLRGLLISVALHLLLGVVWVASTASERIPMAMTGSGDGGDPIEVVAWSSERSGKMRSPSVVQENLEASPVQKSERQPEGGGNAGPSPSGTGGDSMSLGEVLAWGNERPDYPYEARSRGWEGGVRLRLELKKDLEVEMVESSGFDILDRAAMEAAATWKIPSEIRDKELLAGHSSLLVQVNFRLQ